jgi:thiamine pyrophosphate-dependent acetolactate synthase large subunit-like protein
VVGRNPDFVALARACGAAGTRVPDAASLESELASALARRGPTLLEVKASDFRA